MQAPGTARAFPIIFFAQPIGTQQAVAVLASLVLAQTKRQSDVTLSSWLHFLLPPQKAQPRSPEQLQGPHQLEDRRAPSSTSSPMQ